RPGERQEAWLLIKSDDEAARGSKDPDILQEQANSVVSGRSIEQIAAANEKQWHSNRPPKTNKIFSEVQKQTSPVQKARATAKPAARTRAAKAKPAAKPKAKRKA